MLGVARPLSTISSWNNILPKRKLNQRFDFRQVFNALAIITFGQHHSSTGSGIQR